jgi:hypothetical protein
MSRVMFYLTLTNRFVTDDQRMCFAMTAADSITRTTDKNPMIPT